MRMRLLQNTEATASTLASGKLPPLYLASAPSTRTIQLTLLRQSVTASFDIICIERILSEGLLHNASLLLVPPDGAHTTHYILLYMYASINVHLSWMDQCPSVAIIDIAYRRRTADEHRGTW